MPMYEYYCADCHDQFDALRPMKKADEAIQCKHCEGVKTSRVLSLFATHTKSNDGPAPEFNKMGSIGGCCGGGMCGCGH